jgi:malonate-semialdehyde dehydrogenase (acetylating)/methylmalonate-semialdehyde dehydrogenase
VIMPDADMERAVQNAVESCYGCAGQRCLAGSVIVPVGDAYDGVRDMFVEYAKKLVLGDGKNPQTTLGPVISRTHRDKVLAYIEKGLAEGATLTLDGRGATVEGCPDGNWVGPTIFENVKPNMTIAVEEIFGPVVSFLHAKTLEDAIALANASEYGNAASIYTTNGKAARNFASRVEAGMAGVNIGVAAPMAFFPFGGQKGSLFGDTKAHGATGIDFYTERKVVIERWF